MITHEEMLAECLNEPTPKTPCGRCDGSGVVVHGWDDTSGPELNCGTLLDQCPNCHGTGTTWLKSVIEDARRRMPSYFEEPSRLETQSNQCIQCGGSLCVEEFHDCITEREWRRQHGM